MNVGPPSDRLNVLKVVSSKAFVPHLFVLLLRQKCVITSYVSVCRCYSCDNDIPVDISKRVQECVDFLRKQAGLPRLEFSHFSSEGLPFVQVSSVIYILMYFTGQLK